MGGSVVIPSDGELEKAVTMINAAKRPIVVMGYGAIEARDAVIGFAEAAGAPVMTTFKGKGLTPRAFWAARARQLRAGS